MMHIQYNWGHQSRSLYLTIDTVIKPQDPELLLISEHIPNSKRLIRITKSNFIHVHEGVQSHLMNYWPDIYKLFFFNISSFYLSLMGPVTHLPWHSLGERQREALTDVLFLYTGVCSYLDIYSAGIWFIQPYKKLL